MNLSALSTAAVTALPSSQNGVSTLLPLQTCSTGQQSSSASNFSITCGAIQGRRQRKIPPWGAPCCPSVPLYSPAEPGKAEDFGG